SSMCGRARCCEARPSIRSRPTASPSMAKLDASRRACHRPSRASDMVMETPRSTLFSSAANAPLLFPTLSSAQIARIGSPGLIRAVAQGEVLIEGGQTDVPFFVVKSGAIEVIRPSRLGDLPIAIVRADQFTGDISMILGRPALMRLRVSESGEVVQ